MSSVVYTHYSTLEEFLESQRSPTLSRAELNFDSSDTPPPLVDAPDDFDSISPDDHSTTDQPCSRQLVRPRIQPSLTDALLIRELGPGYDPAIAAQAGTQLCCDEPDTALEDRTPDFSHDHYSMISGNIHQDVYNTSDHQLLVQQALTASRRASEKLNDAMKFQHPQLVIQSNVTGNGPEYHATTNFNTHYLSHNNRDKKRASISITSLTTDEPSDSLEVTHLSIQGSPTIRRDDGVPSQKPSLPSLNIRKASSPATSQHDSIAQSPALSRYAISPQDFNHSQTLARIQSHSSPQMSQVSPAEFKQTLPSLETALSSVTDMPSYTEPISAMSRRSPNHLSPFGRSPPNFPQATSTAPLSPPRFSTNPASWRTLSQNSSNSTGSEQMSAPGSANASTPASSAPRHSPCNSAATPHYHESEHGSPGSEMTAPVGSDDQLEGSGQRSMSVSGYACPWPGCTAPPFQTQYLLNSHTNVHSNTRPHFCPVKDCPRGPGGQGFKRKNEMIRYVTYAHVSKN